MANTTSKKRFWTQLIGVLSTLGICALSAIVDYIFCERAPNSLLTAYPWYRCTAIWIGVAIFIVLILPNWIFNWRAIKLKNYDLRERLSRLVANTCSGNAVDIALIFVFLIYTAQISAAVNDAIINGCPWWRPIIYTVALGVSVLQKPLLTDGRRENTAKVLITGLSNITYFVNNNVESSNIEPAILPIKRYGSSIELVVLIVSKESFKPIKKPVSMPDNIDNLPLYSLLSPYFADSGTTGSDAQAKEGLLTNQQLIEIIRKLCNKPDLEVIISPTVDFDNFEECNKVIMSQTKAILDDNKRNYDDCDLMFNISPGTKMLTGAMTINAIKSERHIVYISQDRHKIDIDKVIAYDPNVIDLYEQFSELVMEISDNDNK